MGIYLDDRLHRLAQIQNVPTLSAFQKLFHLVKIRPDFCFMASLFG